MFGSSSDLSLPLTGGVGGLVCESVGKAEFLSSHFNSKQSRVLVNWPSTSQSNFICLLVMGGEDAPAGSGLLW